jgi:diguanylate cyclase (GGDEF)-like protein
VSTPPENRGLLALVVDDNAAIRTRARLELAAAGFRVLEAEGGVEALALCEREQPGIVILDMHLTDLDGFEVCRRLRTLSSGQDLPILMVTANADLDAIERAFEAGASDFATKPIHWALLRHRAPFLVRAGDAFRRLRTTLAELGDRERRLSDAQRLAHVGNWQLLREANQMLWSEECFHILGCDPSACTPSWEALLGVVHSEDRPTVEKTLQDALAQRNGWDLEHRIRTPGGELRFVHHQGVVDVDPVSGERRVLGTLQDVTERRANEEKIRRLAFYDSLTGLPNRRLLQDRLGRTLHFARANQLQVAVLFVDVDRFKWVNDSLGHAAGDRLLSEVSSRLVHSLRLSDGVFRSGRPEGSHFLSRVGGDEFVVTLLMREGPDVAAKVARRILAALARPVPLEGKEISVTGSVGVALFPADAQSPDGLMRCADVAMYHAKAGGRNRYQFYTRELSTKADRALLVQGALRRAIEEKSFALLYQPQVSVRRGRISRLEALIRWEVPGKAVIPPAEFIGIAEETGLILPLGEWALRQACRDCRQWQDGGLPGVGVAVNLSSIQLRKPEIVTLVAATLQEIGLDPSLLELELTESALLQHTADVARNLEQLKQMGVRLALDDFGTGYASLSYLKRIPFDTLKIDREFIRDLADDAGDRAIVSAIVAIGRTFGLSVVAEGVETALHEQLVRQVGCEAMQGYRLGRPAPLHEILTAGPERGAPLEGDVGPRKSLRGFIHEEF